MQEGFGLEQGSRKTLYQTFQEASLVFCALQNARHRAVADEFPDRRRPARRCSAAHAICLAWPEAAGYFRCLARDLRVFAARKLAALSPGVAVSGVGCRRRRARRHYRPRWIDQYGYFGGAWGYGF